MDTKMIEKTLEDFLEGIAKRGIRHPHDIDAIAKAVCVMELLRGQGGESEDEYSYGGSYGGNSYEGGTSTRRGRSRRSYGEGYSGHDITGMIREKLAEVMETADSDMDRKKVRMLLDKL